MKRRANNHSAFAIQKKTRRDHLLTNELRTLIYNTVEYFYKDPSKIKKKQETKTEAVPDNMTQFSKAGSIKSNKGAKAKTPAELEFEKH